MNQVRHDNDTLLLHVRFNGRSQELPLTALALDRDATDDQIRAAVTTHLDCLPGALDDHVVARHDHAIVIRPEAVYG
jgi:hypothetical protein